MNHFEHDRRTAFAAIEEAQRLAFAPMAFQAARVLRTTGLLELIHQHDLTGITLDELTAAAKLPRYGVKVLLEAGLGIGLVCRNGDRFTLTKTGYFILCDAQIRACMDFSHDVCYRGLFDLDQSIAAGQPVGLKEFGNWPTVYEALAHLPAGVQKSWFNFNQYFSDIAFPAALPLVFADRPQRLLDIGGNTGKWALQCTRYDSAVRVTILDLPGQLKLAKKNVGESDRITYHALDLLDAAQPFPTGHDAIWMSQLLDCFSEAQIVSILQRATRAMTPATTLSILEPYWDRQRNATAAFALQQTSLYFTAIANGNSQLYAAKDMLRCIAASGLHVVEDRDNVGPYHTLLKCKLV